MALYSEDTATRSFIPFEEIPATFSDVISAQYRSTLTELPSFAAERWRQLSEAREQGTLLTRQQAEEALSVAGLTGHLTVDDTGITNQALSILIERKSEELQQQTTLARGRGGFGEGTARLGVALATSLLDPVNVGLAFVPVVGEARYARILAGAGGAFGRAGVRAGVGAVEGAVGAAIVEPLIYTAKQQEQADYDMADSLMNVAFGTIFGGGMHTAAGLGADAYRALTGAVPEFEALRGLKTDEDVTLVRNLRREIANGMDARDVERVLATFSPEARQAVLADLPQTEVAAPSDLTARMTDAQLRGQVSDQAAPAPGATSWAGGIVHAGEAPEWNPRNALIDVGAARRNGDQAAMQSIIERAEREARTARTAADAANEPAQRAALERGAEGAAVAASEIRRAAQGEPTVASIKPAPTAMERAIEAPSQVRESALRTAVGQMADGRPVNVEPLFAGDRATAVQASARAAEVPDPAMARQAEASKLIDEEIAASNTALESAEEEAALAEALLGDQAKFLDAEPGDAATEAAAQLTKRAERWSRAAELATACLIRGA